jgi:hypothetical protein
MNPGRKWGWKKVEEFPATTNLEGFAVEPSGRNGSSQRSQPIAGPQLLHGGDFVGILDHP